VGLLDRIRRGDYTPGTTDVRLSGATVSLAEAARRIEAGASMLEVVRDFLDHAPRRSEGDLAELIRERPAPTGDPRADALLAGVAEHVSAVRGLPCPSWVLDEDRFLDRLWFVSDVRGFRAVALAQAPIALKRRGVLWPTRSLRRV
jgi:hypothetical protein